LGKDEYSIHARIYQRLNSMKRNAKTQRLSNEL